MNDLNTMRHRMIMIRLLASFILIAYWASLCGIGMYFTFSRKDCNQEVIYTAKVLFQYSLTMILLIVFGNVWFFMKTRKVMPNQFKIMGGETFQSSEKTGGLLQVLQIFSFVPWMFLG